MNQNIIDCVVPKPSVRISQHISLLSDNKIVVDHYTTVVATRVATSSTGMQRRVTAQDVEQEISYSKVEKKQTENLSSGTKAAEWNRPT